MDNYNERSYKHRWPRNEAIDYIIEQAGTQFNPILVKRFISLIRNDSRVPAIFTKTEANNYDLWNKAAEGR